MNRLHVIVCDDHRMMREALAAYLGAQAQVASVRVAADADETIRLVRHGGDVLVLDLNLGAGESGLDVLEALQNLRIGIPVLVVSSPQDLDGVRLICFEPFFVRPTASITSSSQSALLQFGVYKLFDPKYVRHLHLAFRT